MVVPPRCVPPSPSPSQRQQDCGVKTKTQVAAERAVLVQLLGAVMGAAADEVLAEAARPFAINVSRHFAMLFVSGTRPPPPAPLMARTVAPDPNQQQKGPQSPGEVPGQSGGQGSPGPGAGGGGTGNGGVVSLLPRGLRELDCLLFLDALVEVLCDKVCGAVPCPFSCHTYGQCCHKTCALLEFNAALGRALAPVTQRMFVCHLSLCPQQFVIKSRAAMDCLTAFVDTALLLHTTRLKCGEGSKSKQEQQGQGQAQGQEQQQQQDGQMTDAVAAADCTTDGQALQQQNGSGDAAAGKEGPEATKAAAFGLPAVMDDLMTRVLNCCHEDTWQGRLAGAAAVGLLVPRLPPAYWAVWAVATVRGLTNVMRWLPEHCRVQREEVEATLAELLSKVLYGEQRPGGTEGTAKVEDAKAAPATEVRHIVTSCMGMQAGCG